MNDEMSPNEKLTLSFIVSAILIALAISIMSYISMPTVYMSNATQSCVKVDSERYNCYNLPDKYQVTWIK